MPVYQSDVSIQTLNEKLTTIFSQLNYQKVEADDSSQYMHNFLTIFCYEWHDGTVTFSFSIPDDLMSELLEYEANRPLKQFLSSFKTTTFDNNINDFEPPKTSCFLYFQYILTTNDDGSYTMKYPTGLKIEDYDCLLFQSQTEMGVKNPDDIYVSGSFFGFNILESREICRIVAFDSDNQEMYLLYRNSTPDPTIYQPKAIAIMKQMASQLNPYAIFNLAIGSLSGYFGLSTDKKYINQQIKLAYQLDLPYARLMYKQLHPNDFSAVQILEEAIKLDGASSCFALARLYHTGENPLNNSYLDSDFERSDEQAMYWYEQTINSKEITNPMILTCFYNQNLLQLGRAYDKLILTDFDTISYEWLIEQAENNNMVAKFMLGFCHDYGVWVEQSYETAVTWYQEGAEQGYAKAQCNLADKYEHGKGVQQNYQNAIKYYTLAANQGIPEACGSLANIYQEGLGVEIDLQKSEYWSAKEEEYELYRT